MSTYQAPKGNKKAGIDAVPMQQIAGGPRLLSMIELSDLLVEYAVEMGVDGETALACVRAGTDYWRVEPGSQDYYSTVEYDAVRNTYGWKFDNVPQASGCDSWDVDTAKWEADIEYAD